MGEEEVFMLKLFSQSLFLLTVVATTFLYAGPSLYARSNHAERVHLHGTLIDMTCWNDRAGDTATLLREHTKRCLQMPDCIRSGYAVVTSDGKVYKMSPASDESTTRWIAATQHDANWLVDVRGHIQDGLFDVTKIQLQK